MQTDVQFLFDNELIFSLEDLIRTAKHQLLLISPFIDLDERIKDALNEKREEVNFKLFILFGKNENNCFKSIKKDSIDFLKQFPNIEIRYNERLHAKFYLNDFQFIITSLNLYDYSLAKNIEVGIKTEYASRGLIGKVINTSGELIASGVDKVKYDMLGISKEVDPIAKFWHIYHNSEVKYKTEPITEDKGGIQGLIGRKKLNGFSVFVSVPKVRQLKVREI